MMRSGEPEWVERVIEIARTAPLMRRCGTVTEVAGLTIRSRGPVSRIGEMCSVSRGQGLPPLPAEVCGFRDDRVLLQPLGRAESIEPGARVQALGSEMRVGVGPELLGRVVDALATGWLRAAQAPLRRSGFRELVSTVPFRPGL